MIHTSRLVAQYTEHELGCILTQRILRAYVELSTKRERKASFAQLAKMLPTRGAPQTISIGVDRNGEVIIIVTYEPPAQLVPARQSAAPDDLPKAGGTSSD